MCIFHLEPFEDKLEICWLTKANRSVGMPLDVYSKKLSCRTEVCDSVLFHESGLNVINCSFGISWVEDLHIVNIKKEEYTTAIINALFDV